MAYKFHFLLLISSFTLAQINGQEEGCRPKTVEGLKIDENLILRWTIPSTEECDISYFIIKAFVNNEEMNYTTEEIYMDVNFLPTCEIMRISVTPVSSDSVEGSFHMLFFKMPVPPGADLSLEYLTLQPQPEGGVVLQWDLKEEWKLCTGRFRVLIYNEELDDTEDIYVTDNYVTLTTLRPCQLYTLGVRAVHGVDKEGLMTLVKYPTPSRRIAPPTLQKVTLGQTSVDLEWKLENYTVNSCEVSSISVDASPYFRATYPVRDSPQRSIVSTSITSLQPDMLYFLNVTVTNAAGLSVPFLTAVQTLANN